MKNLLFAAFFLALGSSAGLQAADTLEDAQVTSWLDSVVASNDADARQRLLTAKAGRHPVVVARIQALAAKLGDDDYFVREASMASLYRMGDLALAALKDVDAQRDPEKRWRLAKLVAAPRRVITRAELAAAFAKRLEAETFHQDLLKLSAALAALYVEGGKPLQALSREKDTLAGKTQLGSPASPSSKEREELEAKLLDAQEAFVHALTLNLSSDDVEVVKDKKGSRLFRIGDRTYELRLNSYAVSLVPVWPGPEGERRFRLQDGMGLQADNGRTVDFTIEGGGDLATLDDFGLRPMAVGIPQSSPPRIVYTVRGNGFGVTLTQGPAQVAEYVLTNVLKTPDR